MSILVFHRGGGKSLGHSPNSISTIKWAIQYGAKAIEYDVVYCRDGEKEKIIIIEPKLLKENGLDINHLFWKDIKNIDAGNDRYGYCHVATFEEVQSIIGNSNIDQQIHIKGENPRSVSLLIPKLENISQATVTTFDLEVIKKIREISKVVRVGWIVKPQQEVGSEGTTDLTSQVSSNPDSLSEYSDQELMEIIKFGKENSVNILILCGPRIRNRQVIDTVRKEGFEVGAWGVAQNLKIANRLIGYDIDRFTIDNPEEAI